MSPIFGDEGGGHRWQRIPPTERKGRVHTSTVTVAILPPAPKTARLDPKDVVITTQRGSGAGGQHRNVTDSAVRAVHQPTRTTVIIDCDRSQHTNRERALEVLTARVHALSQGEAQRAQNGSRRAQIGTGERGDKIRTYRVRDDSWTDHRTGAKGRVSDFLAGALTR